MLLILLVYIINYRFATFNIADSSVFLGACLMMLDIFKTDPCLNLI